MNFLKKLKTKKKKQLKYYLIRIFLFVIINIKLFLLIKQNKHQIYFLNHENKNIKEEIYNQTSIINYQDKVTQHNLLNLLSFLFSRGLNMIDNFYNIDEIYSIFSDGGIKEPNKKNKQLCYKSTYDGDNLAIGACKKNQFIIIIRTKKNERIGGFFSYFQPIKSFLFNIDKNGVYRKFNVNTGNNKSFSIEGIERIIIGNEDLVITSYFIEKEYSCYSKFPKKYGNETCTINDLIKIENPKNIKIVEIEVIEIDIFNRY